MEDSTYLQILSKTILILCIICQYFSANQGRKFIEAHKTRCKGSEFYAYVQAREGVARANLKKRELFLKKESHALRVSRMEGVNFAAEKKKRERGK